MADATVINNPAKQKIGNGDAIAAVPGFDVLLIGANDLSAEMGVPEITPVVESSARPVGSTPLETITRLSTVWLLGLEVVLLAPNPN